MIHRSLVTDSATAPPVTTWCPTARAASRAGPTVPGYAAWPWRSVWVKSGYQRRIHHLLNRGETRNSLARDVFHGHRGQLRKHYQVGQENQLDTLGIMINILVLWQTVYIQAALDHLATNGHHPDPALIARLPARAPHRQRPRPIQHHHPTTRRRTAPPPHQRLKPNPAGRSGSCTNPRQRPSTAPRQSACGSVASCRRIASTVFSTSSSYPTPLVLSVSGRRSSGCSPSSRRP